MATSIDDDTAIEDYAMATIRYFLIYELAMKL
jgi:hypothetical protein